MPNEAQKERAHDAIVGALEAGIPKNLYYVASPEVAKTIGDFLGNGLSFSEKQKDLMRKHPMAYMYALSRQ